MAKIAPFVFWQLLDDNADVLSGGKVYTYEAGTTTPKVTYTDADEGSSNANPIILDSAGRADVWLGSGAYKFVLYDSADNLIDTVDDIVSSATGDTISYAVTSNTNIVAAYDNAAVYADGTLTLSLLAATDAGDGFKFWVKNVGTGTVTIDPDGSEQIDGTTSIALRPNDSAIILCDGTEWYGLSTRYYVSLTEDNTLSGDITFTGNIITPTDGELTISSGAITPTGVRHTVDTESDASSDDLDTISGGASGQILIISTADSARDVVIKHGTGNIQTQRGDDITLDTVNKVAVLQYNGSNWLLLSPSVDLLDEDDFASDSDTKGTTQQAAKAYADTKQSAWTYTPQTATTSGTSVTIFDDQSMAGVTEVDFLIETVSTSAANQPPILRIGTSSGIVSTGYGSSLTGIASASLGAEYDTDGIYLARPTNWAAGDFVVGVVRLTRWDASEHIWFYEANLRVFGAGTQIEHLTSGSITLGGELADAAVTTTGGSATFDAGEIRARYR